MRSSVGIRAATALLALLSASTSWPAEREYGFEPPVYALTGGRVVPVDGPVLELATVLLRDGIIEAVSAQAQVPPEAVVIDCKGLTVYPGLIDARTGLLQPSGAGSDEKKPGGDGSKKRQPVAGYGHDIPEVRPERRAADLLEIAAPELEKWQAMGFTSALSVPKGKVFLGQSALIDLSGKRPGGFLVQPVVALHVNFEHSGEDRYPGSLMGVVAVLRQSFHDAGHYQLELERFRRLGGTEVRRPELNASLEALAPALGGKLPVVFEAQRWLDGLRALRLAQEFGLRPLLCGVRDAYRIVPQLREAGAAVILSVDYPEAKGGGADAEDADRDSLEDLRDRARLPETPGMLHREGVPFALSGTGLQNPADFPKRVALAIEHGLPRDAAVAAVTLGPARILGVQSMMGSLTPGKIANVLVTEGELFDKKTKVKYLFIDGRKMELEEKPAGDPNAKIELAGTWDVTVESPDGAIPVSFKIQGSEGSYSGEAFAMGMTFPFESVEVEGNSVTLSMDGTPAGMSGTISFSVVVTEDSLSGSVSLPNGDTATVRGTRSAGPQRRVEG